MSTKNSPGSADSFWAGTEVKFIIGPPRNHEEKKEERLVNSLFELVKDDPDAVALLLCIVAQYNTRIYRLRYMFNKLADEAEAKGEA